MTASSTLDSLGLHVFRALADIGVPCYVMDRHGVVQWLNAAAERLVGDVTGAPFSHVVSPASRAHAREVFAQKVLGKAPYTNTTLEIIAADGRLTRVEVSSVPLRNGKDVVGVFGLVVKVPAPVARSTQLRVTPRQMDVLRLLGCGASTDQIAGELHLSRETVRNHIRALLQALDAHSRVEAVATARGAGLLDD